MDISTNSNEVALIVSFAFFVAGVVKGVIGIGLPTTAITIMTFFVSPLMALGLNLIPMTVANIWQLSKADNPRELVKNYKYFATSLVVCILITSFYANQIGDDVVRLIFAIAVLLFGAITLIGPDLFFILFTFFMDFSFLESQPSPYNVSVGYAIIPPLFRTLHASKTAFGALHLINFFMFF